jgi:amidase
MSSPRASTPGLPKLPTDLSDAGALRLSAAVRNREISCLEVMQAYLTRIHRLNPIYNAIVAMRADAELLEEAAGADAALARGEYRGWLHGLPHAVKDVANARGFVTTFGSRIYADNVAASDDIHIARVRAAGAIFIGKTNVPEFGMGSQSYNDVYGTTRNAYDARLTAGGSSGGAAVGLAAHLLPVADGSDMMGSLRNPAAFNNVIGFRPSQGRVPHAGPDLYYDQLSAEGPMGRNVADTIRLLETMAGYADAAPLSRRDRLPGFDDYRPAALAGLRVGWLADYDGYLATEPGVLPLCARSLAALSFHGVGVEPVMPRFDMARLWRAWLTLRHWSHAPRQPLLTDPAARNLLKPELVWEIEGSFGLEAAAIAAAAGVRSEWYRAVLNLFDRFDLLALPAAQVFPFPADVHWPTEIAGRAMDTYHRWMEVSVAATMAGLPVVSVPAGFDEDGRPMGLQFLGPPGRDADVLEFALAYETVTEYLDKRPILAPT